MIPRTFYYYNVGNCNSLSLSLGWQTNEDVFKLERKGKLKIGMNVNRKSVLAFAWRRFVSQLIVFKA
jgi:hypothetical protein